MYLQIKEDIERQIQDGRLQPGAKLPAEPELAKAYQVSRPTLREALKMLQKERTIVSLNGVGTFINRQAAPIENPLNQLQSLGSMIRSAGFSESESDVRVYRQAPLPEWREKLGTAAPVVVVERTRIADAVKVAFYYNIIPAAIAGEAITPDFKDSIFAILEARTGARISHCITEIVAPDPADPMDKKALRLLGRQIVKLKQLHFGPDNEPVFYSVDYLKSGFIKLLVYRER